MAKPVAAPRTPKTPPRQGLLARLGYAALEDPWQVLLLLAIAIYTWVFSGLAIAQHLGMRTHKADMGQIDQAIWNSSRGRFVEMTDFGFLATRMTDHVEPVLAFISPIYWLWDDPRAILILQVVFVAGGAWLLYRLALRYFLGTLPPAERDKIWHTDALLGLARPVALSLSLAYLLAPPLQAAVLTEFHAVPLVVPMVLWALWAVAVRRPRHFAAAVFLVATVKEETALLAAGLGAWGVWQAALLPWLAQRLRFNTAPQTSHRSLAWLATALTVLCLAWFYIATFVIVPAHAEPVYGIAESGYFARYGALGDSPADILRSFFTQPQLVWSIATEPVRLDYLRRLLMPFGYLSLLAPEVILLSLPVLLANQLSAYPAQYYGEYHYSAPVFVYFAGAAALGVARLWRLAGGRLGASSSSFQHLPAAPAPLMNLVAAARNSRTALRPLLALSVALWLLFWGTLSYLDAGRGPGGPRLDATPITAHHRLLPRFVAQIPRDAAVTATAAVHPHVSHRRFVYQFPLGLDAPTPSAQRATWALLDVTMAVDMAPGDLRARVEQMLAQDWGVVDAADGFLLLHQGAPEKTIPPAFWSFVRPTDAEHATTLDPAAPPLALLATDLIDRPYWRATQIQSEWQVGPGFDPDQHRPRLAIHAPGGEVVHADLNETSPALTWFPVDDWQPGQRIRITTLPHYLPAQWGIVTAPETLVAAYHRDEQDRLHPVPVAPSLAEAPELATHLNLRAAPAARFHPPEHEAIALHAWIPETVHPHGPIHLLLAWEPAGRAWPASLSVFVHLRDAAGNLAQADGMPRYFVAQTMPADADSSVLIDWRQLLPHAAEIGEHSPAAESWELVVGLYDPQTGARVPVEPAATDTRPDTQADNLDEWTLGTLHWQPAPLPDQTCALIPATCAGRRPATSPTP